MHQTERSMKSDFSGLINLKGATPIIINLDRGWVLQGLGEKPVTATFPSKGSGEFLGEGSRIDSSV